MAEIARESGLSAAEVGSARRAVRRAMAAERGRTTTSAVHVVERGECLWTIAEERLGRGASDARVAREVARMWSVNRHRSRSGDPDLIFPGERLRMPGE